MSLSPLMVTSPPALAASRARRQRSNALSRARESEADWDVPADSQTPTSTSTSLWRDEELICPLAALDTQHTHVNPHAHAHTHAHTNSNPTSWIPMPIWPSNEGELQAVLAQFAFPTSAPLGRKHRRSGEMIADNSPNSPAPPPSASSGKRRAASGPTKRASCPHCERGRSSA
jgi:hypothetical protein